jgi:ribosomal protein L11 methyltransferase
MNTLQFTIHTNDELLQEMVIAQLADIDFDSFEQNNHAVIAYINEQNFNEEATNSILQLHNLSADKTIVPPQNWNAIWESNFSPIQIENFVGIRANFHAPFAQVKHEIVITPKMSFGTGHHATTYMIMQLMQHLNCMEKAVFDYGTGTGILAILAEKLGAKKIVAIDCDDWCIENALENIATNKCNRIILEKNNTAQTNQVFDFVIANINKHIIVDNFAGLHKAAANNATILLSGLLSEDEASILQMAATYNWQHQKTVHKNQWIAMQFVANVK